MATSSLPGTLLSASQVETRETGVLEMWPSQITVQHWQRCVLHVPVFDGHATLNGDSRSGIRRGDWTSFIHRTLSVMDEFQ